MCSLGLRFIWSWFHSKILIFTQFMGQNLSYLVRMTKYGHIVFWSWLSQFLSNFDKNLYTCVQETSSYKQSSKHGFEYVKVIWQNWAINWLIIWAWLSCGHRWAPVVRNSLKGSVKDPNLLVNCYLEIKFHKKSRWTLPLKKCNDGQFWWCYIQKLYKPCSSGQFWWCYIQKYGKLRIM